MTFAVLVEPTDNQFTASIAGVPGLRVMGASREDAIAALKEKVSESIERGELTSVEIEKSGLSSLERGAFSVDFLAENVNTCAESA